MLALSERCSFSLQSGFSQRGQGYIDTFSLDMIPISVFPVLVSAQKYTSDEWQ